MKNAAIVDPTREFDFSDKDFDRVCKLIYHHAGIALNATKRDMVYSRLARRLRAVGKASFREYLAQLDSPDHPEWQEFTNALTTNLTSFFREAHHFPILEKHIENIKSKGQVLLWCSAASTGEEPYSMAMTMIDTFGTYTPPVRIIATDVDTSVLEKCERGIYALERFEKMDKDKKQRFFLKGKGKQSGFAKVRPELRAMITFQRLNLLDKVWNIKGPFDAIFCRNVMIYFDKPTQYGILSKFVPLMAKDGLLFAGHSESLFHANDLFKLRGHTVYEIAHKPRGEHG